MTEVETMGIYFPYMVVVANKNKQRSFVDTWNSYGKKDIRNLGQEK